MDSSRSPSSSARAVIYVFMVFGVVCLFALGSLLFSGAQFMRFPDVRNTPSIGTEFSSLEARERYLPTDFAEVGILRFPGPATGDREPMLEYLGANKTTTTIPVVFDGMNTICVVNNWGIQCAAMSITYDAAFDGKSVTVEGIRDGNRILMQKLHVYATDEPIVPPVPGMIYVDWPEVVSALKSCRKVKAVYDNQPEKTVRLSFWGSPETWEALQPLKGSLMTALEEAKRTDCDVFPQLGI
jgi:hypothetical protein